MKSKMTTHNIFRGDARSLSLEDLSVDMILTDPPYNISKKEIVVHRGKNPRMYKYTGTPISVDFGEWDHFKDEYEYIKFTYDWFKESIRVLKFGGHLVSFFDMFRIHYLLDLANKYDCSSRQLIFWRKTNPVPRGARVDFMSAIEMMLWITKKPRTNSTFNYKLGQQSNIIDAPIPGHTTKEDMDRVHTTQKPVKVAKILISYLSNKDDTILDSFCGSGWANIAAKKLGRNSIGIDKRQCCVDNTIERINKTYKLDSINKYKQREFRI